MSGNEIAKLSTVINCDTRGVDKAFALIKGGLQNADSKLNNFKTAVANSSKELQKSSIALATYKLELKQTGDKTADAKAKLASLTTAVDRNKIAFAENKMALASYEKSLTNATAKTGFMAGVMDKAGVTSTGILIGGLVAVSTALAVVATKSIQIAGQFEQLGVSFEVLAGGKQAGDELVTSLTNLANVTPMTTQGLAENARLLLAFGETNAQIIPDLKLLGDISGGNQEKMNSLALAFAQSGSAGRLMGQDLLQMVNAGFNPLQEISRKTGKSMGELRIEMEKGLIPFSMVKQAFVDATAEGGRFYGMMDKQSQTLNGRLSTMADKWNLVGKAIGDKFLPMAKAATNAMVRIADATLNTIHWLESEKSTLAGASKSWNQYWASKNKSKATMVFTADPWIKQQRTQPKSTAPKSSTSAMQSGFLDSGTVSNRHSGGSSGNTSSGATAKSAQSILSDRISLIQSQSALEIAQNNYTDQIILQKKIQTQNRITALYKKGTLDYIQSQTTSLELDKQLNELRVKNAKDTADKIAKATQDARNKEKEAAHAVATTITDGFRGMVNGTYSVTQAFGNMLENIALKIASSGIENMLTKMFGGSGGGSGGVISNFIGKATGSPALGSALGSIFKFANGGNPNGSRPFIAGERGAELVVPSNKTKVFTNKETQGIFGGRSEAQSQSIQPVIVSNTFKVETMNGDNAIKTLQQPSSKAAIQQMVAEGIRLNQNGLRNEVKKV